MWLRLSVLASLVVCYLAGGQLAALRAANPDAAVYTWLTAGLMLLAFTGLVAAMYSRVLPALLALPVLAVALAGLAGMQWDALFTNVIGTGAGRLSTAIIAAILGAVLAQVVEKTGIAQTAIKKTAELGGDKPIFLAVLMTLVIALLFTTLGGLGAVIMVATISIPILLSLGLRPLYVGCLFLLAMSLGGAFNLANWALFKDTLGLTNAQIGAFAFPFASLMLVTVAAFMVIEGKRMGKARFKAETMEQQQATPPQFVPWYALLTPIIPLLPVLFFALQPQLYSIVLPKRYQKPVPVTITIPESLPAETKIHFVGLLPDDSILAGAEAGNGETVTLPTGKYVAHLALPVAEEMAGKVDVPETDMKLRPASINAIAVKHDAVTGEVTLSESTKPLHDFPIAVALLFGILYGALTTWRRGQSTVQLLTKSAFDGVAAVGPAVVLMIGIGMVLIATMSPEVSGVIGPMIKAVVPTQAGLGGTVHYVLLFGLLAPLALYRGPFNIWGMGAGLIGLLAPLMPAGAIMGAFMSVGMIQGVSDPTNTHNVWVANYTNTDVQDILKRTLPYMWALAFIGLLISAVMFYR